MGCSQPVCVISKHGLYSLNNLVFGLSPMGCAGKVSLYVMFSDSVGLGGRGAD